MANKGRPLGSKKQGAPKKIIEKLDQILRYHNDLSLLDNIQNWVTQSCNVNITLLSNNKKEFEDLKQTIKLKTNEMPFEKIHVGPGIAIGTDIPAAGGFHQLSTRPRS